MLILLHLITIFVIKLMRKRRKISSDKETRLSQNTHDEEAHIKFDPPVYLQRFGAIFDKLIEEKYRTSVTSLTDFGCAEFGLFVYIKRLETLREIYFVDVDEELLEEAKYKIQPLTAEYIRRRKSPLVVEALAGSVAEPDLKLFNCDVVTAIELIEHLYPDVLDAFPHSIFGQIQPRIAFISTPNADFNLFFRFEGRQFRHWDHKFEWTREQFHDWVENIVVRYPNYSVTYLGLGESPDGQMTYGHCTQMAIFERCDQPTPSQPPSHGICTYESHSKVLPEYKSIALIEFPYDIDLRTNEERTIDTIKYRLHLYGSTRSRFYNEESDRIELPLIDLLYGQEEVCITCDELNNYLLKLGYSTEECAVNEAGLRQLCVVYLPVETQYHSNSSAMSEEDYIAEDCKDYSGTFQDASDWDEAQEEHPAEEHLIEQPFNSDVFVTEDDKKPQESLFDSGYQKSSIVDDSPHSPSSEEFDVFEDSLNAIPLPPAMPNGASSSSSPNSGLICLKPKPTLDINRINEQDTKNNRFQLVRSPVVMAGPSCSLHKSPLKSPKSILLNESYEEACSIAECLVENTLNKIEDEDEDTIEEDVIVAAAPLAAPLVENGDLANNNRDREGNNYPEDDEVFVQPEQADLANDNLEVDEGIDLPEDNVNIHNNNEGNIEQAQPLFDLPVIDVELAAQPIIQIEAIPLAQSSRDVSFDPNLTLDSLEDFDSADTEHDIVDSLTEESYCTCASTIADDSLVQEPVVFPDWLLNLYDSLPEGTEVPQVDHTFLCQGDGLGVHPSHTTLESLDDDDDEPTITTSSTNNSAQSEALEAPPCSVESSEETMVTANASLSDLGQDSSNKIESSDHLKVTKDKSNMSD